MGRKKEVLKALDALGIDYCELASGEVLFEYCDGNYWFHPDDSKPEFVTLNKFEEYDSAKALKARLSTAVNEINKGAPLVKAVMIDDNVLLNCDLYTGRHRLCPEDLKGMLIRLETVGKLLDKLLKQ